MTMWRFFSGVLSRIFGRPMPSSAAETQRDASPQSPRVVFRAPYVLMSEIRNDLMRPHAFAHERVGFIAVRAAQGAESIVLLAEAYHPVADEDYVRDPNVGAMMGSEALRKALELAMLQGVGIFHVHMHGPWPYLWFSDIDLREQDKFVPDFFTLCPQMPHGAVVLDAQSEAGRVWLGTDTVKRIDTFETVGSKLFITHS